MIFIFCLVWTKKDHFFFQVLIEVFFQVLSKVFFQVLSKVLGNLGQALFIKSCDEDVIFTRKSHNFTGTAFVQGDSVGGSKLTEQTLNSSCRSFMKTNQRKKMLIKRLKEDFLSWQKSLAYSLRIFVDDFSLLSPLQRVKARFLPIKACLIKVSH